MCKSWVGLGSESGSGSASKWKFGTMQIHHTGFNYNLSLSSQVIPMWSKLVEELEPIGFVLATVHSEHERELARKVGVRELPHLLLLTDGKVSSA
jgi:hypothetical protein